MKTQQKVYCSFFLSFLTTQSHYKQYPCVNYVSTSYLLIPVLKNELLCSYFIGEDIERKGNCQFTAVLYSNITDYFLVSFGGSVLGTRMVTRTCVMLSLSWIVGLVILWGGCFGGVNASADETLTRADKERLFYLSTIFEKYSNNNEILLQNVEKLMVNLGLPQPEDVLTLTHEVDNAENDTHCHDTMAGCPLSDPSLGPTGQKPTKRSVSRTDVHKGHNKVPVFFFFSIIYKYISILAQGDPRNPCESLYKFNR